MGGADVLSALGGAAGIVSVVVAVGSLLDKRRDARSAAGKAAQLTMETVAREYDTMLDEERSRHDRTAQQRDTAAEANLALVQRAIYAEARTELLEQQLADRDRQLADMRHRAEGGTTWTP